MIKENAEWYNGTIFLGQEEIQRTKSNVTHFISQKWSHFVWFCANGFHRNAQKELQLLGHK